MSSKKGLSLVTQPEAYFYELVTESLGAQKLSTQPETEFYLVNLLNKFVAAEKLREEPLALMIKDAIEHPVPQEQGALFRQVGDVSLYTAGFFQDSLARKLVDVDYYINMGGTAYAQVAARSEPDGMRAVYEELAHKFGSFVEVLARISDKTTVRTEKDLLRMYDLWLRTKSERAAKALQDAGILPNDTIKKDDWQ